MFSKLRYYSAASIIALFLSQTAFPDTYNFYFKPKKPKVKVSSELSKEEAEAPAAHREPETTPEQSVVIPGNGRPPIIIRNQNTNTNEIPIPASTIEAAPIIPSLNSTAATVPAVSPARKLSKLRFGVAGQYYPAKSVSKHFWNYSTSSTSSISSNYGNDFYTSSTGSYSSVGGVVSLGLVLSHVFAFNFYTGVFHAVEIATTMYHLGVDAELYPFNARVAAWEVNPVEFGFIGGISTNFFTDGRIGEIHAGVRLNLNLSNKFGLYLLSRASFDYGAMGEVGFITRF